MALAVDPPASPSSAAKRQSAPTAGPSSAKRARVVNFDAEEDLETGPAGAENGTKGSKNKDKVLRKQEAVRLRAARMQLPIWDGQAAILDAVAAHDTVIILGETGSGKTTQLPQFLLQSSIPVAQPRIAVTQPRRVAAMSLATRVAAEMGSPLGGLVGYTVRFADRTTNKTRLKYMTDGTLLAEMLGDKDLNGYDVIVLDEAHERSLRTDMLMGFLKGVQRRRKESLRLWKLAHPGASLRKEGEARDPSELKIVVMSATLDAERFSKFFSNAPVLYVKGRQFDVKIMYTAEPQDDYCEAALKTFFTVHLTQPPGDVLIFLPGQEDIDNLQASIESYLPDLRVTHSDKGQVLIRPLYAKLPPAEQALAFTPAPPRTRKVILATNVAETSVTIPGVKYVIDTGYCKEKEHHAAAGIDSLVVEAISRSSAMQRTGRAGRESAGICYRLYTEDSFLKMPRATKPEIQRVSLTFALLQLLASGEDDVWSFEYMDPPSKEAVQLALLTLKGLDAIDKNCQITPSGLQMSRLPLDPLYARVLLASFNEGCPSEIIDLVSLLGQRDSLLISSIATREAADQARKKFSHRSGDHMMLLNILRAYEDVPKADARQWCRDHFVNIKSLGNALEARRQLTERCERLKLDCDVTCGDDAEAILSACLTGLFGNTAVLQPDGSYRHTMSRLPVAIHPGSSMSGKKTPAIMYDELVFTTKTYARGVSAVSLNSLRSSAPAMFSAIV